MRVEHAAMTDIDTLTDLRLAYWKEDYGQLLIRKQKTDRTA